MPYFLLINDKNKSAKGFIVLDTQLLFFKAMGHVAKSDDLQNLI